MTYTVYVFEMDPISPMRTKVPFGAIDKVGNNFPDLFGFKNRWLQVERIVYFGSFTRHTYRTGGLKHPV